jgi:O-antigen/teichoic acid export membrane protein
VAIHDPAADAEAFVSGRANWLRAPTLPAIVAYLLPTSFLRATSRFLAMSLVAISQGLAGLLIATGLSYADALDLFGAALAFAGSFALADVLALIAIGHRHLNAAAFPHPQAGAEAPVRYGAQGQMASVAQLSNCRLDRFLVTAVAIRASVGHYAVTTSVSESVWWLSGAVTLVLLPRLSGLDRKKAAGLTPVICRKTVTLSVLAAIALAAVSPLAIPLLFREDFEPAGTPLMLLKPGIVAISAARIPGSHLYSQGKVIYNT